MIGHARPRPAFVVFFYLLEKTLPLSLWSTGALHAPSHPGRSAILDPLFLRLLRGFLVPALLCPASSPAGWCLSPGEPICSLVPSDTHLAWERGVLSPGACCGESLTSGGFGSSGGRGEMGVPRCGHGGVEPTALGGPAQGVDRTG